MAINQTPASTSDARKRKAEKAPVDAMGFGEPVVIDTSKPPTADQPPVLPDTSDWVRREPGDVIEAGTPYVEVYGAGGERVGLAVDDEAFFVLDGPNRAIWTPPPAPDEPWSVISTDREKPTLAKVDFETGSHSPVCGEWYVADGDLFSRWDHGWQRVAKTRFITSVELLSTYNPETHVPVERALIEPTVSLLDSARWFDTARALDRALADDSLDGEVSA